MSNSTNAADNINHAMALPPKHLKETLVAMFNVKPHGRSVCIEGSPGLGKTTVVKEAAKEANRAVVFKHLPTMQPEDFGLPMPNGDKTGITFLIPDWFPSRKAVAAKRFPEYGVLLMDDRNQADDAHQKILANIIQERELHGEMLADGWCVVSTGNRQSDRAGANRVLAHLRNRETVLEFQPDLDQWCEWAYAHGVAPEVVSFIRMRPELLSKFDPNQDANPTPRSWVEGISSILGVVPKHVEAACFSGAVGAGPAAEFLAFLKTFRTMPDPDLIIRDPMKATVPTDAATKYAIAGALISRATNANFSNILKYLDRKEMDPEYSVMVVRDVCRMDQAKGERSENIKNSDAFMKWILAHQNLMFDNNGK